ncbi:cobalt-precorrin-5B (C(1))-methyltransferase [Methylomonas denitrificans]|uniref:cobalt-precorrin-5B (C(1))-methyltransferase n=1 Tax=Methylomonas denitrificans TaxID=1538553 RepID=UPI002FF5CC9D
MGDFLTPALDAADRCGIQNIIIGGMVGKLTKMAQGETITHAGRAPVDVELVADIARGIGAPNDVATPSPPRKPLATLRNAWLNWGWNTHFMSNWPGG